MRHVLRLLPLSVGLACGLLLGWWFVPHLLFEARVPIVPFSHAVHAGEDVGMACADCHRASADGAVAMPTLDQCTDCHDGFPGVESDLETLLAAEPIWRSRLEQPEGVHFPHATHVDLAAMDCATCHGDHGASDTATVVYVDRISEYSRALWDRPGVGPGSADHGMDMGDCSRCHDQRGVVQSCLDCHR